MKSFFSIKFLIIKLSLALILFSNTMAQELSLNVDFVNRYIWRGIELGSSSPSIQPNLLFTAGGFGAGVWGAYPFANENGLEEVDIYMSYAFALGENGGALSFGFTDYINPNSGTRLGNIHNHNDEEGPGAHFLEVNAGYAGPESFPLTLSFNVLVYNVVNNPIYFQVGYNTSIEDVGFGVWLGGTTGDEARYYGTENFNLINVGISASKEIKVTENFSLPVYGQIILNPNSEKLFYVIGIRI